MDSHFAKDMRGDELDNVKLGEERKSRSLYTVGKSSADIFLRAEVSETPSNATPYICSDLPDCRVSNEISGDCPWRQVLNVNLLTYLRCDSFSKEFDKCL